MVHDLKILPQWFSDVESGKKTFEIRKNDRDYKVGDKLTLREWKNGEYTGRSTTRLVSYIYYGDGSFGLAEGYCILGIL